MDFLDDSFSEVVSLYETYGGDKYLIDEDITQTEHVLQAAYLAAQVGAPEYVIIGLLVHDVGQVAIRENLGKVRHLHKQHDEIGAAWLKLRGIPTNVIDIAMYHTLAKVVLCEGDKEYFNHLSAASKASLKFQQIKFRDGDYVSTIKAFDDHPFRQEIISARFCDDMAKIPHFGENQALPGFQTYHDMFFRVLKGQGRPAFNNNWQSELQQMYLSFRQDQPAFEKSVISAANKNV
eukprot:TRINITY_DN7867_c0_g1_i1.p1 TRINITY_DN7867_c0_g1~~TRINITY_DN7867_c0_g1_i1.p1  ORF type:complete len:235 (-),score=30.50 TRINITY_DN7867_c0_g1_i1:516-1220(-)